MIALMLGVVLGSSGFADMTPAQKAQAQTWIGQFTAEEFKVRQEAVNRLIKMGEDMRPLLEQRAAETQDEEVKLRCRMVIDALDRLKEPPGKTQPPRDGQPETMKKDVPLELSKVTLDVKDRPLDQVLAELKKQTANQGPALEEVLAQKRLTVKVNDATYWEAMDAVCQAAGTILYLDDDRESRVMRMGSRGRTAKDVGTCVGPVVLKLAQVGERLDKTVRFTAGGEPTRETGRGNIMLEAYLEPRIPVQQWSVHVERDLTPLEKGAVGRGGITVATRDSLMTMTYSLDLQGKDDWPVRLVGKIVVEWGTTVEELKIADVFARKDQEVLQGARKLRVTGAQREGDTIRVQVETEEPGREMVGMSTPNRFLLESPDGRKLCVVRMTKPSAEDKPGLIVARMEMEFQDLGPADPKKAWGLVCRIPTNRQVSEFPFSIQVDAPTRD